MAKKHSQQIGACAAAAAAVEFIQGHQLACARGLLLDSCSSVGKSAVTATALALGLLISRIVGRLFLLMSLQLFLMATVAVVLLRGCQGRGHHEVVEATDRRQTSEDAAASVWRCWAGGHLGMLLVLLLIMMWGDPRKLLGWFRR